MFFKEERKETWSKGLHVILVFDMYISWDVVIYCTLWGKGYQGYRCKKKKKKKKDIALPTKQHKTSRLPAVTQFMCNKFTHAFNGFEIKEVHMEERMGVELLVKFEARGFWRSFKSNLKAPQPKKKKKKRKLEGRGKLSTLATSEHLVQLRSWGFETPTCSFSPRFW